MYMLTFIIVVVYGLFVWKQICVQVFIVRLSKYRLWGSNYNKFRIPLTVLSTPHTFACPKPGPKCTMSYVVIFCVQ